MTCRDIIPATIENTAWHVKISCPAWICQCGVFQHGFAYTNKNKCEQLSLQNAKNLKICSLPNIRYYNTVHTNPRSSVIPLSLSCIALYLSFSHTDIMLCYMKLCVIGFSSLVICFTVTYPLYCTDVRGHLPVSLMDLDLYWLHCVLPVLFRLFKSCDLS
jgi:hypothetical protein